MMHVARFSFRGGEPIPVFLGLFKDKVKRKPCVVCDGEFMETSSGEVLNVVFYMFGDTQRTPRTGKSGFPPRSVFLDCHSKHKLNCCFRCHDFNTAAKLDDNQEVTCPDEGCKNILTPSQVEAVARPDTFARYDKMQLQKGLDTMPCFRWCVNEHCSAGQDNDLEGCPSEYKFFIECNACGLPMCFLHGRVWHLGQTCEEYDVANDLVGGRDPETDRWLLEHAKPCPGCQIPVEKNGGCFHMTCKSCKMEFCWVCLADWKNIRRFVDGRMTYNVSGHNSECYFRRTHVQPHLAIGNDVGDAIRDAEELFWLMPQ
ncbi:hypothetical protein CGMCC3_g4082 [Colletotrichum fructicola]|nr:uncharacterized protein CGMCC3_g4082 [Colletotrichum fructicola]KAE9579764.1 hypothetical protein CGMCC3_g4082 [Colletotrichum fructicola]